MQYRRAASGGLSAAHLDPDQTVLDARPVEADVAATIIEPRPARRRDETLILGSMAQRAAAPAPAADHSTIMPVSPRTGPLLGQPPTDPDPTEVMLAPPRARLASRPRSHSTQHQTISTEGSVLHRPVLVAHVIAPRRNVALVAALLAWTLAVAFGVYLIVAHRDAQRQLPVAPTTPSAAAPMTSNAPLRTPVRR